MAPPRRVAILGAGMAGLSAAMHVAAAGHDVTVVDREPVPGGRIGLQIEHGHSGSYRIDTGPSVLGARDLVEECFTAIGAKVGDFLDFQPVNDGVRAHFPDGSSLLISRDRSTLLIDVDQLCGGVEAEGLARYLDDVEATVRLLRPALDQPPVTPQSAARLAQARLQVARTQPQIERFVTDERLRRLYSYSPVRTDSRGPLGLLALYHDLLAPAWFPRGGMYRLPAAMGVATADAGVRFHYGTEVTGLRRQGRKVQALVTADGDEIDCDAVILTCGPAQVRSLLGLRERRFNYSSSALVLGFGGQWRVPEGAAHRSVVFGRLGPSDDVTSGRLPSDPTMLVNLPTLTDPSLAPAGRHIATVLTPTPNLGAYPGIKRLDGGTLRSSQDWVRIGSHYRSHVIARLAQHGYHFEGSDFDAPTALTLTPVDWLARGNEQGTPFGTTGLDTWWLPIRIGDNAVLAGAARGPGTGVAQAILSGMLASDRFTDGQRPRPGWGD